MAETLFNPELFPKLTPQDVFLYTTNPIEGKLERVMSGDERGRLRGLRQVAHEAEQKSEQAKRQTGRYVPALQKAARETRLSYLNFVVKMQKRYPAVRPASSRREFDLTARDGQANLPFVLANMDTVTGARAAEMSARAGGWGVWPQSKPPAKTKTFHQFIKSRDPRYLSPVIFNRGTSVKDARAFFKKRIMLDTAVVVDEQQRMIGILKKDLLAEVSDEDTEIGQVLDRQSKVNRIKIRDIVSLREGKEPEEALELMRESRLGLFPVVDGKRRVKGAITRESAKMYSRFPPNVDAKGRLKTAVAVSVFRKNVYKRVEELVEMGVDAIILDSPHLDQGMEYVEIIRKVREIIDRSSRPIFLVAGNVIDPEAAKNAIAAGAHAVKVGIGPGHVCTTRDETGVGEPQWSAVYECVQAVEKLGGYIWADGGVRLPGDAAKLLAAGASQVMIGTIAAGNYDSPGPVVDDGKEQYVEHYGMGSDRAFNLRDDVEWDDIDDARDIGRPSEGLRKAKVMVHPDTDTLFKLFRRFAYGTMAAGTFSGAKNMEELAEWSRFGVQTPRGYEEGKGKAVV